MKNIQKYIQLFLFILPCWLLFSCIEEKKPLELQKLLGRELWTCTNLRVLADNCIYWQNYGSGKIFPLGSSIHIVQGNLDVVTFVDQNSNEYKLHWRKNLQSQWEKEMPKYFSNKNPEKEIQAIEEEWQSLILYGNIKKGMPKEMVLLSRGYPATDDYEKENIWMYYENQDKKILVYFEDNVIVQIVNL